MVFTSTIFVFLFLPVTVAAYYLVHPALKNVTLLLASLCFYGFGEPRWIAFFLVSIAVNYCFGLILGGKHAKGKRFCFVLALVLNFGLLFYFKYLAITLGAVNALTGAGLAIPSIALPLGISFFTFRAVSYLLDVYWETVPAQKNPLDLALYISFFPQVSMGPITKYTAFQKQLHGRTFQLEQFSDGVKRISVGLCKKLILANNLGLLVDQVFAMDGGERSVLLAWAGIIGYLLQLYYDFSGYSDMAIGVGQLFGFSAPENFRYPYASKSVAEFWNRWHITLGAWFKDYLYTPIFRACMGRGGHSLMLCNIIALFAVWLCIGVWHGTEWKYIVHGLYYFVFIALERVAAQRQKERRKRLKQKKAPETHMHAALSHVYFIVVLLFGQLLFRIDLLRNYFPYIKSMFGLTGNVISDTQSRYLLVQNKAVLLSGLFFCFPILPWIKKRILLTRSGGAVWNTLAGISCVICLIIGLSYVLGSTYQAFIYFNF